MPEYIIAGTPVHFPFEPYDVQKAYMEKVITCCKDGTNGVLESPTGTGKTLSLLCSSLAWVLSRKLALKAQLQKNMAETNTTSAEGAPNAFGFAGVPKIVYASRTHSQLTQAMQELKRTAYSFMRSVVLGSRDQLCIHPEVMREQGNSNKIQMCKLRVQTRTCSFHLRVESKKDHPDFRGPTVLDIEDLIKVGQKLKMCPYYSSKELVADADIIFMPYNYLIDPNARKANKIELKNAIVILDEAHNIEKICEESASVRIRSSDIAMAIDDVTHIMKVLASGEVQDSGADEPKDFTIEDLALLKDMLMNLEAVVDDIVVDNIVEGATFPAEFIFELLQKAQLTQKTMTAVTVLLDKLLQYLAVESQNSAFRKGGSFQVLSEFLTIVFANKEDEFTMSKVYRSFKVHIEIEESKQNSRATNSGANKDGWISKPSAAAKAAKIINYWCFNPGFGMEQFLNTNVRSIILTSGTLAPLKPLIAELSMPVAERLENPHIVDSSQVYVKIIGTGPDQEPLISNYVNRDNPKYIKSLGHTILNVSRIVPDGLLVFFPSYPLLHQCTNSWQASGLWGDISRYKPIFVEPRGKEDFTNTMEAFYQSIRDSKGACFMAVCRGKVSEGLDFADRNGRAVIITGLPFPPLKDPKVILKRQYLDTNRTKENELLSGQAWYALDGTRAVNQAIGRVIRHRHDYGAILLCDSRFAQPSQVQQLSKWIRGYLGSSPKSVPFASTVRQLRDFFKLAEKTMPQPAARSVDTLVKESCEESGIKRSPFFSDPKQTLQTSTKFKTAKEMSIKIEKTNSIESWTPADYTAAAGRSRSDKPPSAMDFMSRLDQDVSAIDFNNINGDTVGIGLVNIHKRERSSPTDISSSNNEANRKRRYKLVDNSSLGGTSQQLHVPVMREAPQDRQEFLKVLRSSLTPENFTAFTAALLSYKHENTFDQLLTLLLKILGKPEMHYMLRGMRRFLRYEHKTLFDQRIATLK